MLSTVENDIRTFYSSFNKFISNYIESTTFISKQANTHSSEQPKSEEVTVPVSMPHAIPVITSTSSNSDSDGDNNILLIALNNPKYSSSPSTSP